MSLSLFDIVKEALIPGQKKLCKQLEKFEENDRRVQRHLQVLEQSATRLVTDGTDDAAEFEFNEHKRTAGE